MRMVRNINSRNDYTEVMNTFNTKLKDRILWYDGDSSMTPQQIEQYLLSGRRLNTNKIFVTELDEDVQRFNNTQPISRRLSIKGESISDLDTTWTLPDSYKELNVKEYIFRKLLAYCANNRLDDEAIEKRIKRVEDELKLYSEKNLLDILKTLIYVVDMFKEKKVVWGTGRGSSCNSYILYLIELHDVDSIKYDLDINEFLR